LIRINPGAAEKKRVGENLASSRQLTDADFYGGRKRIFRRKGLWHLRFMKIGGNPEAGVGGTASYRNSSAASASVNSEHS